MYARHTHISRYSPKYIIHNRILYVNKNVGSAASHYKSQTQEADAGAKGKRLYSGAV